MISKARLQKLLDGGGTFRKQFSAHTGVQKEKKNGRPTFSVPFDNGLCRHFCDGTGLALRWNEKYRQFYCFLNDQKAVETVELWERKQGTRVFLRNLLNSSLALDFNFEDNVSRKKTNIGILEERAKHHRDHDAIAELAHSSSHTISDISFLSNCDFILGVPAMPDKEFDVPRSLAETISNITGKLDITRSIELNGKDKSAKAVELSEKWEVWEKSSFDYSGPALNGRRIIIIDDKYQSGVTMQFWASKLVALGAKEVHGLSMVKTLRDTDNL